MATILEQIAKAKTILSFILHFVAIAALYSIALIKGIDTSNVILMVAVSYGSTQTAKQISAHFAAKNDPEANTNEAIKEVNDK